LGGGDVTKLFCYSCRKETDHFKTIKFKDGQEYKCGECGMKKLKGDNID